MNRLVLLTILSVLFIGNAYAQSPFREIQLSIGETSFYYSQHTFLKDGKPYFFFYFDEDDPWVEVKVYPNPNFPKEKIELIGTGSYSIVDSLREFNNEYSRFKVRFRDLHTSNFLSFVFRIQSPDSESFNFEIPLLPLTETRVAFDPAFSNELFIGEEKTLELFSNNPDNLRPVYEWQSQGHINFRISRESGRLYIHLLTQQFGDFNLSLRIPVNQPALFGPDSLRYNTTLGDYRFIVRSARTVFLNINRNEVSLKNVLGNESIDVELDYHRTLQLNKTYRIEDQQSPGGKLVAEIFTKEILATGKVLSRLRIYDYHHRSQGYLYIKDGDIVDFFTNFDILPEPEVSKITVQRSDGIWVPGNVIYPGENVIIKLDGIGLSQGQFSFDGLMDIELDSLTRTDKEIVYSARVPMDIQNRHCAIIHDGEYIGSELLIKEYSKPRPFDFVYLTVGKQHFNVERSEELVLTYENIRDVMVEFDRGIIDQGVVYGPQIIEIEVSLRNNKKNLLDSKVIKYIKLNPEGSPREAFYTGDDFTLGTLSLNRQLRSKIFDLEDWSSIELTFRHDPQIYGSKGQSKYVSIVIAKEHSFDVDVSFPAGLVIKQFGVDGFGNLGGISMAMMAEFTFYQPNRVAKEKPYKVGAGFLALNAFNFSENNSNRDVGIAILGSLYPLSTGKKLSFPLYTGGGYFLSGGKFFWLIGPGIRVSL
ncbi:MAG: hypothetical protein O2887_04535 [Bacteroidetes bacterium]|nr:hypothetical protein [Bacteroidota bacterium]MDA1119752.1 hypothetical protein [Bacteroidota bacterium]